MLHRRTGYLHRFRGNCRGRRVRRTVLFSCTRRTGQKRLGGRARYRTRPLESTFASAGNYDRFRIDERKPMAVVLRILAEPGYREINIPPLGRTWTLRVVEMPELEMYGEADIFSVKFAEDVRGIPTGYPAANAGGLLASVVSLDGKPLDKYGIIVTSGLEEFERAPKMKKTLTRTTSLQNGQVYDADFVRYAEKEVTFGCCLNGVQTTDFWNLYDAFFGDLLKPGIRKIGYGGKEYSAFYRKTGNWKLHSHNGGVVCEFDLTLCFTAFSIGGELYLLAAENGYLLITEDGFFIDLK